MKKILALVLALAMALALVACGDKGGEQQEGGTPNTTGEEKVVKIGVFEPLTGDNGAGGKQEVLGMQYANYVQPTVDINGETYKVQLEVVDNRTAAENGPSAAAELVNKGVSIVLGSYGSGVSMAGGTVFAEAGVPAIGVTCTNPQVTSDCDVYFRICFLDPFQGTVLANYAYKELGVDTAYTARPCSAATTIRAWSTTSRRPLRHSAAPSICRELPRGQCQLCLLHQQRQGCQRRRHLLPLSPSTMRS